MVSFLNCLLDSEFEYSVVLLLGVCYYCSSCSVLSVRLGCCCCFCAHHFFLFCTVHNQKSINLHSVLFLCNIVSVLYSHLFFPTRLNTKTLSLCVCVPTGERKTYKYE